MRGVRGGMVMVSSEVETASSRENPGDGIVDMSTSFSPSRRFSEIGGFLASETLPRLAASLVVVNVRHGEPIVLQQKTSLTTEGSLENSVVGRSNSTNDDRVVS